MGIAQLANLQRRAAVSFGAASTTKSFRKLALFFCIGYDKPYSNCKVKGFLYMSEKKEILFTAGQFAALHNINKRTLHYYDQIGLFSPACKGENGYRYYTYLQSMTLELLLTMRELGMSIEEIRIYMENCSAPALLKIIDDRKNQINQTIFRLKKIKNLLQKKEDQLIFSMNADLNAITLAHCPKEYLIVSPAVTVNIDNDLPFLVEHSRGIKEHRLYNRSYGTMLSIEQITAGQFETGYRFYTKVPSPKNKEHLFQKPAGVYLRGWCVGLWDKLPAAYSRMLAYAQEHGYTLTGYSYEEGINEMAISSMEEYITQIEILVENPPKL